MESIVCGSGDLSILARGIGQARKFVALGLFIAKTPDAFNVHF